MRPVPKLVVVLVEPVCQSKVRVKVVPWSVRTAGAGAAWSPVSRQTARE